jgi:rubrerythrin
MSPERYTMLEAVAAAVTMEEEGVRFYTLAMEKAADPEVQIMSRFLRDVEYEHFEHFRDLLASLSSHTGEKTPTIDPDTESYLRYLAETGVFPAHSAAGHALNGVKDVCDMLRLGIQAEKDSILYYRDLIEQVPFPDAAAAIGKILSEEKQHFLMLSGLLRRLLSTRSSDSGLTD